MNWTTERILMGHALANPQSAGFLFDKVRPEHFQDPQVKLIYAACKVLLEKGEFVDLVTVNNQLAEMQLLEAAGGPMFLAELCFDLDKQDSTENSSDELESLIERNRQVMPPFMLSCDQEMKDQKAPSTDMKKMDFIKSWLLFFDPSIKSNMENLTKDFVKHSVKTIQFGFEWTVKHFAELDLGGNYKWYGISRSCVSSSGVIPS